MSIVELLQWAGTNGKTGVLEIERSKIRKRIAFREGRIVGCSSDDPSTLLGQFLISRGMITKRTLQFALRQQKVQGQPLPEILVDMGVVSEDELTAHVVTKSSETIYGLFEWEDAIFRFEPNAAWHQHTIEVDLSVDHTLLNGAQRQDELKEIRQLFTSSDIVLRRTGNPLPAKLENGAVMIQILELVDGNRTLAEILLHAHASEFAVLQLLRDLHSTGNVELSGQRSMSPRIETLVDVDSDRAPLPPENTSDREPSAHVPSADEAALDDALKCLDPSSDEETVESRPSTQDLDAMLQVASSKLDQDDHEGAFDILDSCYQLKPNDDALKRLMYSAEASYLQQARSGVLRPETVPVKNPATADALATPLNPAESKLMSLIDGQTTIQEIIWVIPQRELQVMRSLHRFHASGRILFADLAEVGNAAVAVDVDLEPAPSECSAELSPGKNS